VNELDPGSKQVLQQLLAGADMPDDRRRAVWSDIEQSITRDAPLRIGDEPVAAPTPTRRYVLPAALAGALLAAGLVGGLVVSQVGSWRDESSERTDRQAAEMLADDEQDAPGVAKVRHPNRGQVEPPPSEPPVEEIELLPDEDDTPRRNRQRPTRADPREELALLVDARDSVNTGQFGAALTALRKHERAYPKSSFARERRLLKVKALCGSGKLDEARTVVDRYGESNPGLRNACPALR
jgi:hypothetical protein